MKSIKISEELNKNKNRKYSMSGDIFIEKVSYKFTIGINSTTVDRPFFTGAVYRAKKVLAANQIDTIFKPIEGTGKRLAWDISKFQLPIINGVNQTEYKSIARQILDHLSDMPKETVDLFNKEYYNNKSFTPIFPTGAKEEVVVVDVTPKKSFNTTEALEALYPLLEKLFVPRSELTKEVLAIISKHEDKMPKQTFQEIKEDIKKLEDKMPEVDMPIKETITFAPIEHKEKDKEEKIAEKDEMHPSLVGKKAIDYTREDISLLRVKDFDKFLKSITGYLPNKDAKNATKLDLEEALYSYITVAKETLKAKALPKVDKKVEEKEDKPKEEPKEEIKKEPIKAPDTKPLSNMKTLDITEDFDISYMDDEEFYFDEDECSLESLYEEDMPTPADLAIDKKYSMSDAMAKLQKKHLED